jgi:hypothetical protein
MSRYGTGMRSCCDSPAHALAPHIVGCHEYRSPPPTDEGYYWARWHTDAEPNGGIDFDGGDEFMPVEVFDNDVANLGGVPKLVVAVLGAADHQFVENFDWGSPIILHVRGEQS